MDMNQLYSIRQVAELTGLSLHTLRYYEKIKLLKDVEREENGYRVFTERDVSWILFLIRLRETGMPITKMIQFSDLRNEGSATIRARRELLEMHREAIEDQLHKLQENLSKITDKITYYKELEDEL
jgi:DNA-binding transcriptional MerR regulator